MTGERRHRIHGVELPPVKEAVRQDLHRRVRESDDLEAASILFRVLWRFEHPQTGAPNYPNHSSWESLNRAIQPDGPPNGAIIHQLEDIEEAHL